MSSKYFEIANKVIKFWAAQPNYNRFVGSCKLVSAEQDRVKVEFEVTKDLTNSWDTLHGGCTATLVDNVTTIAVLAHDTNKHPGVSVDLKVSYLAAAKLGETVVMDASVEKRGRNLVFTRADLYEKSKNKLIAFAHHVKAFPPAPPNAQLGQTD